MIPRVVGVDLDGPSAIRRATTLQDIPGSPVSDLRYQERSSTSVYLLWDPPLRANGVITRYTIFVIELDKHVNVSGEMLCSFSVFDSIWIRAVDAYSVGDIYTLQTVHCVWNPPCERISFHRYISIFILSFVFRDRFINWSKATACHRCYRLLSFDLIWHLIDFIWYWWLWHAIMSCTYCWNDFRIVLHTSEPPNCFTLRCNT